MQDWNVDPHMAFPAYKQLQQAGFEIKGLFGQWGHHYPDRPGDHNGMSAGRGAEAYPMSCLLYTSPSPRDATLSRMPSSA